MKVDTLWLLHIVVKYVCSPLCFWLYINFKVNVNFFSYSCIWVSLNIWKILNTLNLIQEIILHYHGCECAHNQRPCKGQDQRAQLFKNCKHLGLNVYNRLREHAPLVRTRLKPILARLHKLQTKAFMSQRIRV